MLGEPAIKKYGYEKVPERREENLEWNKKRDFRTTQFRLSDYEVFKAICIQRTLLNVCFIYEINSGVNLK